MGGVREEASADTTAEPQSALVPEVARVTLLCAGETDPLSDSIADALATRFLFSRLSLFQLSAAALAGLEVDVLIVPEAMVAGRFASFLQELREDHRRPALAVLVLLSEGDSGAGRQIGYWLDQGADDVLSPSRGREEFSARVARAARQTEAQRSLIALAQTDALTGLANYRALRSRLEEEFKRAARYGYPLAAVMVDLDHLKAINDGLGHELGNRAIQAFAAHLRANLREVDFAARFGGDEFVVLLPHQTAQEARVFAERLRQGLESVRVKHRDGTSVPLVLTLSAGVVDQQPAAGRDSADALIRAADRALYLAKQAGRNRVELDEHIEH